ncbi:MAG: IS4 family transposase [Bryobacterales bacterium]|nr:IS4 family transposase [Bryobacterales bacterium]MCZ2148549.1 IS4 family transposase [Bryobacterales bacterium]
MIRVSSIFSQLLQFFPRLEFEALVRKHAAERHARGFTCWQQFVAMLFCQLAYAQSLREICGGLAALEGKLRHLGVMDCPKTTTLSYANAHRPWQLYRALFEQTLARCQAEAAARTKRRFRFKHKLLSLDSSMVELCAEVFDWAQYKRTKGALKLHLVLDHDGFLPCYAVITEGKTADVTVARTIDFAPGTLVVFDRGYSDYDWWLKLTRSDVHFVTRLKDSARYGIVECRPVVEGTNIIRDEVILLTSQQEIGPEARLRRIELWVEEKEETMVLLTNNLKLAASTIARIYRDRWQVELFFKALKQGLKVKTFVGTSENAVQIQIWTALIAILVLKYLQLKSTFGWSLSNMVALLRQQLFVYRDLWTWLNDPYQAPPPLVAAEQLALGL